MGTAPASSSEHIIPWWFHGGNCYQPPQLLIPPVCQLYWWHRDWWMAVLVTNILMAGCPGDQHSDGWLSWWPTVWWLAVLVTNGLMAATMVRPCHQYQAEQVCFTQVLSQAAMCRCQVCLQCSVGWGLDASGTSRFQIVDISNAYHQEFLVCELIAFSVTRGSLHKFNSCN